MKRRFRESMNQWINEPTIMKRWFSESMNQWTKETVNQWTNESMNHWTNESVNPWINESNWMNMNQNEWTNMTEWLLNDWLTACLPEWRKEGRNGRATSFWGYFFTERHRPWGTSSLSYVFAEQHLIWATSALNGLWATFCSFCNLNLRAASAMRFAASSNSGITRQTLRYAEKIPFAHPLHWAWQPPAAIPHSRSVAASLMLSCAAVPIRFATAACKPFCRSVAPSRPTCAQCWQWGQFRSMLRPSYFNGSFVKANSR